MCARDIYLDVTKYIIYDIFYIAKKRGKYDYVNNRAERNVT